MNSQLKRFFFRSAKNAFKARALAADGDTARDRGDWQTAARMYTEAVVLDPSLVAIWVQLGHARGETGDTAGRECAYLKAWSLAPDVADTALHLGHVSKVLGKREDAAHWYARALAIDPSLADAARELQALENKEDRAEELALQDEETQVVEEMEVQPAISLSCSVFALDVTDLFEAAVNGSALDASQAWWLKVLTASGKPMTLVSISPEDGCFHVLSVAASEKLLSFCCAEIPAEPILVSELAEHGLADGTTLFVTKAAWLRTSDFRLVLSREKINNQIQLVLLAPDLTELTQPQWFAEKDARLSAATLRDLLTVVDIAAVTASEDDENLQTFCALSSIPCPCLEYLPLENSVWSPAPAELPSVENDCETITLLMPNAPAELSMLAMGLRRRAAKVPICAIIPSNCGEALKQSLRAVFDAEPEYFSVLHASARVIPRAIASTRILVVPASCDNEIPWVTEARQSGIRIAGAADAALYRRWGGQFDTYVAFEDTEQLSRLLSGAMDFRTARPARNLVKAAGRQCALLMERLETHRPAPIGRLQLQNGIFYQFGTEGARLNRGTLLGSADIFRDGSGWGRAAELMAMIIGGSNAVLRMKLPSLAGGAHICRLLIHNTGPEPVKVKVAVEGDVVAASVEETIATMSSDWLVVPLEGSKGQKGDVIRLVIGCDNSAPSLGAVGFIVYPRDKDHYWFEFMDRAARGYYPELRRIIT